MTEKEIQNGLRQHFDSMKITIPNFTPANWWECDFFAMSAAGYFYEFEIKLTRSDFTKDKHKSDWYGTTTKHDKLAAGAEPCPNNFTFVVPEDMIGPDDVPEWAGLYFATMPRNDRVRLRKIKPPPRIHKRKFTVEQQIHALQNTHNRYWYTKAQLDHATEQLAKKPWNRERTATI